MFDQLDSVLWRRPRVPEACPARRFVGGYMAVTPTTKKTFFRLLNNQVEMRQWLMNNESVFIEIRYKGVDVMVARYDAFQRDLNGMLGFMWDAQFLGNVTGLYIGDVYVGCNYCFSVNFRLAPCEAIVDTAYNDEGIETCSAGECAPVAEIGVETLGGTDCPVPYIGECGAPAPFFTVENPGFTMLDGVCFDLDCAGPTPAPNPPLSVVGTIGD